MTIVTLQPSTGIDSEITDAAPTVNFGARTEFRSGKSSLTSIYKGLIKFDLSSIPAGATIDSAILSLWCTLEDDTIDRSIGTHRSLVQWYEGDSNGGTPSGDGSSWNLRNIVGSVAWAGGAGAGAGSDYVSGATATTAITGTGAFFAWNLTSDVEGFMRSTFSNHGWWCINTSSTTGSRKTFASSDSATAAERPKLAVTYSFHIVGVATGSSTVTGSLQATGYLAGVAAGTSVTTSTLLSNEFMQASSTGLSTVQGSLNSKGYLRSTLNNSSAVTGDIQGEIEISGSTAGTSTAVGNLQVEVEIFGSSIGFSTVTGRLSGGANIFGFSIGTSTVTGSMFGNFVGKILSIGCNPVPLLYITDGSIKINGQLNILNFLSEGSGFRLREDGWRPQIAQYKEGGRFSNGPLAQGRRLRYRNFDNVIDTFALSAVSQDQDSLIEFQQELLAWQEYAADYWVSDYTVSPVYLVARAARETNTRYAIIHMISVPELENPYTQPFYSNYHAAFSSLTPRIERGHWLSKPPGELECVAVSSIRSWTVSGWGVGV